MTDGIVEEKIELSSRDAANILGQYDEFAKKIEKALRVSLVMRDESLRILGTPEDVRAAKRAIVELSELASRGGSVTGQNVDYLLSLPPDEKEHVLTSLDGDCICHTISGKPVKPKTLGQQEYVHAIRENMIVFGLGPAGTGKTYLAMAMAITAFRREQVGRIILTRPAIEAGEKLGFLPGDLQSKVDPYLRPLYDALYQIMGVESFQKNMEKGLIEVAPLAYMRGRTLDNAFVILDEAQNTTQAQMKMFLTRIGFGSKAIITGDLSQKDLAPGVRSGLDVAREVLKNVEGISFCTLTSRDVIRHPLVQKIVEAYEKYEKRTASGGNRSPKGKKKR